MLKFFVSFVLMLATFWGYAQKRDTIRVYNYEAFYNRFQLTVKNNSEFTFIYRLISDTLHGKLSVNNDNYSFLVDTSSLHRGLKQLYTALQNNFRFARHKAADAPLLYLPQDTAWWFRVDTTGVTPILTGRYMTSTGFVGCFIDVKEDGTISFETFSDVGGAEGREVLQWLKKGQTLHLKGKSHTATWFTDTQRFYLLPYYLIGRKVQQTKSTYTETYHYFVKQPTDR